MSLPFKSCIIDNGADALDKGAPAEEELSSSDESLLEQAVRTSSGAQMNLRSPARESVDVERRQGAARARRAERTPCAAAPAGEAGHAQHDAQRAQGPRSADRRRSMGCALDIAGESPVGKRAPSTGAQSPRALPPQYRAIERDTESEDEALHAAGHCMLPCEICGMLFAVADLSAHQSACAAGGAHAGDGAVDEDDMPIPCEFCCVPQPMARLEAHERLCSTRRVPDQRVEGGATPSRADARSRPSAAARPSHAAAAGPSHAAAAGLSHAAASSHTPAGPAGSITAGPTQGGERSVAQDVIEDEIEDPSSSDDDDFAFVNGPSWQAHRGQVGPSTYDQPALPRSIGEALFPHFRSIASFRRDGITAAVDYLGQFSGMAKSAPRGGVGGMGATIGADGADIARSKGRGQKKAKKRGAGPRRDTWRVVGGRKVYFDESGQQNVGARAGMKYSKARATRGR